MVTGAASGIGRSIALKLAAAGADVSLCDVRARELAGVRECAGEYGRRVKSMVVDVSRFEQVEQWVAATDRDFGRIDILVNSAGMHQNVPFLEVTLEDWNQIIAVNLTGTFLCSQAVAKRMVRRKQGRIVNIASIAGRGGRPTAVPYAASKAAVINLSRSMALALAESDIRVNAVCPGITATPMWERLDEEKAQLLNLPKGEPFRQAVAAIPLRRAAHPDEIADAVLFLCAPSSEYITGQAINVCGGLDRD